MSFSPPRNSGVRIGTKVTGVIKPGSTISQEDQSFAGAIGARVGLSVKVNGNQGQHLL